MPVEVYAALITALGALLAALVPLLVQGWQRRKQASGERASGGEPVHALLDRLTGTLREARGDLDAASKELMRALDATSKELEQEVDRNQQLVAKLEADARVYEQLAQISRPEAEAFANLVRAEVAAERRRPFWTQFAINFGFFLTGVAASVWLLGS